MYFTKQFFRPKNMFLIIGGTVLLYACTIGGFAVHRYIDHKRYLSAINAQKAKINALSPAEKSIRKAQIYEASSIVSAQTFQRLLFDYLQRTYNLAPELSVAKTPLSIPTSGATYPTELNYMARIAFPKNVITTPPKDGFEGASYTNVYAANCDNIALPSNFWQAMEQNYNAGTYLLTHDMLALVFLKDNDCSIPASETDLGDRLAKGMAAIAGDPNSKADLRYEAVALLLLTGNRTLVKSEWVDAVVAEQLPDGSWPLEKGLKSGNDHATVLALWTLLQYSRPEVKYQPLIRH